MVTDNLGIICEDWVPENCTIIAIPSVNNSLEKCFRSSPNNYREQFKRRLSFIGNLKKPISNKNYMYLLEDGYYESYIFGKNSDLRLVFNWLVSEEGITVITLGGLYT